VTPAEQALQLLAEALRAPPSAPVTVTVTSSLAFTPERFAVAPDSTRLGVEDLACATGKSRSAIYKLVQREGLPCRRLPDRTLVFVVGEVRRWFAEREAVVNPLVPRLTRPRRSA
jgi:predicted DNA-binding transcriptional regulator AlpA